MNGIQLLKWNFEMKTTQDIRDIFTNFDSDIYHRICCEHVHPEMPDVKFLDPSKVSEMKKIPNSVFEILKTYIPQLDSARVICQLCMEQQADGGNSRTQWSLLLRNFVVPTQHLKKLKKTGKFNFSNKPPFAICYFANEIFIFSDINIYFQKILIYSRKLFAVQEVDRAISFLNHAIFVI